MCGQKSLHGGRRCLLACVMVLLVLYAAPLFAQESTPESSGAVYQLSESEKQQLLAILQTLADKYKTAMSSLDVSEKALAELKAQSAITEQQYQTSQKQLAELRAAWDELKLELDGLKNDKTTLTNDLVTLQAALQTLEDKYRVLEAESTKLSMDYQQLQEVYKAQTESYNKLNKSFAAYRQSVQAQKSKSLILEIILALVATGWGLDAIGMF
ncbi:MAG: hypothetical protein ABFD66_00420 [Smithella sp.]